MRAVLPGPSALLVPATLLATALLATAVLALAGCCFPVDPPESSDAPTPPPGPTVPVDDPVTLDPPDAHEAEPATVPASPAPRWALRPDSGIERRARENILPQLDDGRALFTSIKDAPSADAVQGGLLLCDLQLPDTPWFKSRPDLRARFHLGAAPVAVADGPNNRDVSVLSVPLGSLGAGDRVKIEVFDRDLFNKDDFLDAADTPFPGRFPLIVAGSRGKLQATCRHVDAETVTQRLTPAVARAEEAMTAWESAIGSSLDVAAFDLGYPWPAHEAAEDGIDGVAALMGWSEPRVREWRARRTAALAQWAPKARDLVKRTVAEARAPADTIELGDGASLGPLTLFCGEDATAAVAGTDVAGQGAPQCVLDVAMVGVSLPPLLPGGRTLDLVFDDGRTERLTLLARKEGRALFNTDAIPGTLGRSAFDGAVLARISDGEAAQFIRLR